MVSSKQYSICFNDLQVKLVAQSNLEYAVLILVVLKNLGQTPVVTSVKLEVVEIGRASCRERVSSPV